MPYSKLRTKKAFRDAVKHGDAKVEYGVHEFPIQSGRIFVEGPLSSAHTWYAIVRVRDGKLVEVIG